MKQRISTIERQLFSLVKAEENRAYVFCNKGDASISITYSAEACGESES